VELTSVAKGPKFRPQNTKGAEKNCVGLGKSGAEFLADLSKKGRKGPNFSAVCFCTKTVIFRRNCNFQLINPIFPYHFAL
jgi:hypothetical protein